MKLESYKVDVAHEEQKELVLIGTTGSFNTWRVFFDIHEDEEARIEEEREWVETKTTMECRQDEEGRDAFYEVTEEIPHKEIVITKTFRSRYLDFTKHVNEEVSAVGLMKEVVLGKIDAYDSGSSVNAFYLNNNPTWLNKETRVGLMNSTNIQKASGQENTTLWLGNVPIEINCDLAINLLGAIEMYALECFNKTAEHKRNVELLTTVKELIEYDYTSGYPEKLNLVV